jgi:hypothetical protein
MCVEHVRILKGAAMTFEDTIPAFPWKEWRNVGRASVVMFCNLTIISNSVLEWLIGQPRIRGVSDSYLCPETSYPEWNFSGFTQSLQAYSGIIF